MAVVGSLPTEEQLLCCICLDVFTNPVTLPCGHNFCKNCITEHFNFNSQRQCPMCKEHVDRKCKLGINTFISEMAVQFRKSAGRKDRQSSEQQLTKTREVFCDVPTGTQRRALRSCMLLAFGLVCLTIFFAINLNLHQTASSLKTHQLFDTVASHRTHHIVPLKVEYEVKKKELRKTEAEIQKKIQERQLKIEEVKHLVWISKKASDREMADGVHIFTAFMQSLERAHAEFNAMIKANLETTEEQATSFTRKMEQQISELVRRQTEVKQLSRTKDHLHFLQSFPIMKTAPLADDLPEVSIPPASYEGLLRTAMMTAVVQLTETASKELEKLHEAELMRLRQSALDVTLDPDTAHPNLILSDDGKQVHYGDVRNGLPDNSKRFDEAVFVLGKQSFSCGRFYYDVQVKGKTAWILGVAKESVNRKGEVQLNPENGIWALFHMHEKQYIALASQPVSLSVNDLPEKVRVVVDYDEGLVSFYNVDATILIYSFTGCSFTERLHPFVGPGIIDSAPLIISSAVINTD
ncbi:nuclear factor 7, ovary-like [Anoplopoma fimbria]|uniref:nuclear factor 7, ovary-like n=1 Tax=Anoplopoma fimbria TaxID=229290 RepID=UPI0023ECE165|nr:nuclear factor 7, ovary-like [Anoplopoma fimbria]